MTHGSFLLSAFGKLFEYGASRLRAGNYWPRRPRNSAERWLVVALTKLPIIGAACGLEPLCPNVGAEHLCWSPQAGKNAVTIL